MSATGVLAALNVTTSGIEVSTAIGGTPVTRQLLLGILQDFYETLAWQFGSTVGVTGALTVTGAVVSDATTDSTSKTTGAVQTDGGLGVVKALWVGGLANVAGAVTLQSTLAVTGAVTGASYSGGAISGTTLTMTGSTVLGDAGSDLLTVSGQTLIGHTASVGVNPNVLQIKSAGGFGASLGIVSANDEIAGSLRLASSGSNSIVLQIDPDNLRASSEFTVSIDSVTALTIASTGAATFASTLAVTGAATLSSTLAVTGAATFGSTGTVLTVGTTTGSKVFIGTGTPPANAAGMGLWAIGGNVMALQGYGDLQINAPSGYIALTSYLNGVSIGGKLLVFGANDSFAAGYRTVNIENA